MSAMGRVVRRLPIALLVAIGLGVSAYMAGSSDDPFWFVAAVAFCVAAGIVAAEADVARR